MPRLRNQLALTLPSSLFASPSSHMKTSRHRIVSPRDGCVVSCWSTVDVAPRSFAHSSEAPCAMQHSALESMCSVQSNGPFLLFAVRWNSEQRCFDDSYWYLFSVRVYHAIYRANVYFFITFILFIYFWMKDGIGLSNNLYVIIKNTYKRFE